MARAFLLTYIMEREEEIKRFLQEVMDKTYPLCKHDDNAVNTISSQLNSRAYRLLKELERKEQ